MLLMLGDYSMPSRRSGSIIPPRSLGLTKCRLPRPCGRTSQKSSALIQQRGISRASFSGFLELRSVVVVNQYLPSHPATSDSLAANHDHAQSERTQGKKRELVMRSRFLNISKLSQQI